MSEHALSLVETGWKVLRRNPKPLSAYRSVQAYVLLGDPGSGKTTSFRAECEELGDQAKFISARDFLVYEAAPEELQGRTLFIDGLDEVRAGALDVRSPFDRIRGLLIQAGQAAVPDFVPRGGLAW